MPTNASTQTAQKTARLVMRNVSCKDMIVPDNVRKCVAFLGIKMADESFIFSGSVFWLGQDNPETGKAEPVYAVTARHVIDGIRRTGVNEVWFRINKSDGSSAWLRSDLDDWFSHSTDGSLDVAILKMGVHSGWDHLVFPYSLCMTDERMVEHEVALGDEVFVTGLFRHHHGTSLDFHVRCFAKNLCP
jgi:hypothetical protein